MARISSVSLQSMETLGSGLSASLRSDCRMTAGLRSSALMEPGLLSPSDAYEAPLPAIALPSLGDRVLALEPGRCLTLVGVGSDAVGHELRDAGGDRCALFLPPAGGRGAEAILRHLLDDLADLALACWPRWYGRDRQDPEGLLGQAPVDPGVSAPWLRAAAKRAAAGYRPRFRRGAASIEFGQLMRAIVPADPVLIAAIDPTDPSRAGPMVQVLEWCAAHGASVVATFPSRPAFVAPYDRVLYGAVEVVQPVEPLQTRFVVPSGRAHHASAIEQRVEAALRRDPELAPLFSCNETVAIHGYGTSPRVDLLWRDGRVVVELDGPEHQDCPNFANDRHRDYGLLVAGYLVLRITNDQVATDLQAAIEKIRAVVRFRRLTISIR
jgi:very-short-patch-repair endonuclease